MNITKQQWTIIGVVVAVILVWYFFLRKKKATEAGYWVNKNGSNNSESGFRTPKPCPPGVPPPCNDFGVPVKGIVTAKQQKCPDTCQTISVTTPAGVQTGCKCPTTNTGSIGWSKPV